MNEYEDLKKWEEENTFITIYTYDELNKYIDRNGVINVPLEIRGLHITKLKGVKRITKHFTLGDTGFEDLGDLEIIEGDFTIWNIEHKLKLDSFENLKVVNGDVNLRYTNLKSLGSLNYIGRNLNLRDTEIMDLSSILKVGGNIFLPKKFKSIIDLTHIELGGKVKYWNKSRNIKIIPTLLKELTKSEIEIPHWKFQYIISYQEVQYEESNIQEFYEYFKKSFYNENYIDVRGETNYLFTFLLELRDTLIRNEDYPIKKKYFKILSDCYPVLRHYTTRWIIDTLEKNNDYEYLKEIVLDENNGYIIHLHQYFYILNYTKDKKLDPDFIWKLVPISSLTSYGLDNLNDVKEKFKLRLSKYDSSIIDNFRKFVKRWNSFDSIDYNKIVTQEMSKITLYFEMEIRESENDLRSSRELPKIGEGWISETELYYNIKKEFSNLKVIHHGKPKWLGKQHLDIYIQDYNIGIEYQGKQHSQSVEYFGGETSFKKQILLDEKKKVLCKNNNCELIEVFPNYDFELILKKVLNIIEIKKKY